MNRNTGAGQQALVSVSSGQYMGVRDSLTNSVPYPTKDSGRMILHDGNQAVVSECTYADLQQRGGMRSNLTACGTCAAGSRVHLTACSSCAAGSLSSRAPADARVPGAGRLAALTEVVHGGCVAVRR